MDNKKNQKKAALPQKKRSAPAQKPKAAQPKKQQPPQRPKRVPGANAKSRQPQKAPHAQPRKHAPVKQVPTRVAPEVVYLPPKPFSRNRFVLHLATVVAVVLALVLGLSVFFKVERIEVSGCQQYTAYEIQQASGISEGDQLLAFSRAKAAGRIIAQLPYVKNVRIGITLPDTVNIEIEETRVTYCVEGADGLWWLMDSEGRVVQMAEENSPAKLTQVIGVVINEPAVGEMATAFQQSQTQTDAEGNTIPVTVTAQQRLDAVIRIAGYLENCGIIGQAASINVTDLFNIEVWYGTKFQVLLGDSTDMARKIEYLKSIVDDYAVNRPYEIGILDISDPEWIEFQAFEEEEEIS